MAACGRTPLDSTAGGGTLQNPDSGSWDAGLAGRGGSVRDGAATAEGGATATMTSGFTQISAGAEYACGLRPGGTATCWGDNS